MFRCRRGCDWWGAAAGMQGGRGAGGLRNGRLSSPHWAWGRGHVFPTVGSLLRRPTRLRCTRGARSTLVIAVACYSLLCYVRPFGHHSLLLVTFLVGFLGEQHCTTRLASFYHDWHTATGPEDRSTTIREGRLTASEAHLATGHVLNRLVGLVEGEFLDHAVDSVDLSKRNGLLAVERVSGWPS